MTADRIRLTHARRQAPGDRSQHLNRRVPIPSLLEPEVVLGADPGQHRDFLAAQSRRAAALRRKAQRNRIKLGPTGSQISAKLTVAGGEIAHPVSYYTMIKSLLYQDTSTADLCLHQEGD